MKDKERDILDDLFQSKLYDFEADTEPGDWHEIAGRLPRKAPVPLYRKAAFWAAAAVVALLLMVGGLHLFEQEPVSQPIAREIQKQTEEIKSRMAEELKTPSTEQETPPTIPTIVKQAITRTTQSFKNTENEPVTVQKQYTDEPVFEIGDDETPVISRAAEEEEHVAVEAATDTPQAEGNEKKMLIADASATSRERKAPARKWGFGMGAGSFSVASNNVVPGYVTNSGLRSESLMLLNSSDFSSSPKTDVKHRTPISFGLGISRYLNDRFSLQTGLTYTYLSSEWKTNPREAYHVLTKQHLHFIGIPLSVTYKITEWNRFLFYASAGVMGEINVAGHLKSKLLKDELREEVELTGEKINKRMKEPLFSANVRLGVSYPIIRFVSAYGEVGAGYYFDNGSDIETIRSEKPFNINAQLGFRLNF